MTLDEPAGRCSSAPPPACRSRTERRASTIFRSWFDPGQADEGPVRTTYRLHRRAGRDRARGRRHRCGPAATGCGRATHRGAGLHRIETGCPYPPLCGPLGVSFRVADRPRHRWTQHRMDRFRRRVPGMASRATAAPALGDPHQHERGRAPVRQRSQAPRRIPARGVSVEGRGRVPRRHRAVHPRRPGRRPAGHGRGHPAAHRPAACRPGSRRRRGRHLRGHGRGRAQPRTHHPRLARLPRRARRRWPPGARHR